MAKKPDPELLSIQVKCSCGQTQLFSGDNLLKVGYRGADDPCECCGSHGGVWINFTCDICKKFNEIEVSSW
jgi:hypothetical protein